MTVLLLALLPILILITAHFLFPSKVTLMELGAAVAVSLLLAFGLYQFGRYAQMADTELWNGEVTGTSKKVDYYYYETKSCDSKGENCTTTVHEGHDMGWYVQSNIGQFTIDEIDCGSSSKMVCLAWYPDPTRWTQVRLGDPVTAAHSYTNYVQAANNGLFYTDAESLDPEFAPELEYPIQVYDYYHVDRVLSEGVEVPGGLAAWNSRLEQILKTLGPTKQANVIVVMTNSPSQAYAQALMTKWEGANKNDIVVIAGFPDGTTKAGPAWVSVHSWAKEDLMNVVMRDDLLDNPEWWASPNMLMPNLEKIITERFVRRPMAEFEYLADEIEPSMTALIIFAILGVLAGLGMAWWAINEDVFDEGGGRLGVYPFSNRRR